METWIALAGLGLAGVVQLCGTVWWGATISAEIKALKDSAKENGSVRDLVIELRADMRNFSSAVREMGEAIRELRKPSNRRSQGDS
jgi:hypothetical protein